MPIDPSAFYILCLDKDPFTWRDVETTLYPQLREIPNNRVLVISCSAFFSFSHCPYKVIYHNRYFEFTRLTYNFTDESVSKKRFFTLSANDKQERRLFFHSINDILDKGYVSHLRKQEEIRPEDDPDEFVKKFFAVRQDLDEYLVNGYTVKKIDFDNEENIMDNNLHSTLSNSALLEVVQETSVFPETLFISEKTLKAILGKNMFLLIGNKSTLNFLRMLGFKTFDKVFNETYDDLTFDFKRVQEVSNQLHWFCSLPEKEAVKLRESVDDIVEHNYNHYMNFDYSFGTKNKILNLMNKLITK